MKHLAVKPHSAHKPQAVLFDDWECSELLRLIRHKSPVGCQKTDREQEGLIWATVSMWLIWDHWNVITSFSHETTAGNSCCFSRRRTNRMTCSFTSTVRSWQSPALCGMVVVREVINPPVTWGQILWILLKVSDVMIWTWVDAVDSSSPPHCVLL